MIWFGIIFFIVLTLLGCLLFPKLNIMIEYRNGKLKIAFRSLLFGYTLDYDRLRSFSGKRKKKTDKDTDKASSKEQQGDVDNEMTAETLLEKIEKAKRQYDDVRDIIETVFDYVGNRVEFSDIYIRSRFGTGDAAKTGMVCGTVWTLIGNVYAFLCRFFNVEFPEVDLIPSFNEKVFEIEAEGIIRIRPVHIIMCGLKILGKLKRQL